MLLVSPIAAAERFPLGPIGAKAEVEAGSAVAVVVEVTAEDPGDAAGLAVGDRIVAVGGEAFPEHTASVDDGGRGPQKCLGEAVDSAGGDPDLAANGAALRAQYSEAGIPAYPSLHRAARALVHLHRYHTRFAP